MRKRHCNALDIASPWPRLPSGQRLPRRIVAVIAFPERGKKSSLDKTSPIKQVPRTSPDYAAASSALRPGSDHAPPSIRPLPRGVCLGWPTSPFSGKNQTPLAASVDVHRGTLARPIPAPNMLTVASRLRPGKSEGCRPVPQKASGSESTWLAGPRRGWPGSATRPTPRDLVLLAYACFVGSSMSVPCESLALVPARAASKSF